VINRSDFDLDLRYGVDRENAFGDILAGSSVEVKSDRKAATTGNFFLEFRQHGRNSGIAVTKADFWAIEFARNCWIIIPTETLKAVGRQVYKRRGFVKGGDGNNFDGVLVSLTDLIRIKT